MQKPQTHFTPGPWKFTLVSSNIIGCKGVSYIMVEANDEIRLVESCDRPLLEKTANGALIAAAPDMFSAIVKIIDKLEAAIPFVSYIQAGILKNNIEELTTIIEKATFKD